MESLREIINKKRILQRVRDLRASEERIADIVLKRIEKPKNGKDGMDGKDGLVGKDGMRGREGLAGRDGKDGKDADEAKIISILSAKLEEMIKNIKQPPGANQEAIAKWGPFRLRHGGGNIVTYADLTSQLDGVTKVFKVSGAIQTSKIVSVHYSSVPYILQPVTDWTFSYPNITFTNALAAGQNLIIIFTK